jgi:hypothetical protein
MSQRVLTTREIERLKRELDKARQQAALTGKLDALGRVKDRMQKAGLVA